MKKHIYFLIPAILFSFSATFAQNQVALQHNGATTLFTTIPDAVAAAVSGDTIYLPGGSFPGFNIDKTMAIIGVGHHPDSTAATGMTLIYGSINFISGDCDGSMLTGLRVNGYIQNGSYDNDNIQISRCFVSADVSSGSGSGNWTITECLVREIIVLNNSLVNNNFIGYRVTNGQYCQIRNNVFLGNGTYAPVTGSYCTVNNNIFKYCTSSGNGEIANSLFDNNIWSAGDLTNGIFGNGNIGTGNINDANFDGLFNSFSYTTYNGNPDSIYQFDFHLINPAYNTGGTDGMPIGIYGGVFPWKEGSIPFNPRILFQDIGSTTDPDGNLLINIHVEAQDH